MSLTRAKTYKWVGTAAKRIDIDLETMGPRVGRRHNGVRPMLGGKLAFVLNPLGQVHARSSMAVVPRLPKYLFRSGRGSLSQILSRNVL